MNDEMEFQDEEVIQVLHSSQQNVEWQPVIGEETYEMLSNIGLPDENAKVVRNEAISILSKCIPPTQQSGQGTGIVVGYIQSGKTLSFTTVAALARDNQYQVVIVIAGTSKPLTAQSEKRLRNDLRLEVRNDRKWRHIHNPRVENNDHNLISNILAEWQDNSIPATECRTVLITVMKNHIHLSHLIGVLSYLDLCQVPVLIIDDEADQAGLNNLINEGDESTTYQRLRTLKEYIPHHTFLQYTATPQGPLLINLIDVLSPDFAVTLTPGDDYVGGQHFFQRESLVRDIPTSDIATRHNPLLEPPDSLLEALRFFFLGVAIGWIQDRGRGNRTMMIHPSRRTVGHNQYYQWVLSIYNLWKQVLQDKNSLDYEDLINEFRDTYNDLNATLENPAEFELIENRLLSSIRRTELHLVNAVMGRTPEIDWSGAYSHILVGGQALDRGFTVEGLTVTYMPRGVGARRADTIQQRARFFGYKRPYLGFCRVFLEQEVASAFRRYVEHEEDIRRRLAKHAQTRRPLSDLRRIFLLTRSLMPTRNSIIDIDYVRANFNQGWFYPKAPHDSKQYVASNKCIIDNFLNNISFVPDKGHSDRTKVQQHLIARKISMRLVYEQLLTKLQFSRLNDAQNFLAVLVIIFRYIEEKQDAECTIYQMSNGRARKRNLNENSEILNLFQGAYPVNPPEQRGTIYPGDREIHSETGITLQIHNLNIPEFSELNISNPIVPNIALWIPREIVGDVIIQDQGNLVDFNEE